MRLRRSLAIAFAATLAWAAPASAVELAANPYAIGPATIGDRLPAAVRALVPAQLRPLVQPLLARRASPGRPRPGATSMFEPQALIPLAAARDGLELGVGYGRASRARGQTEREGWLSGVVVVYVGTGF